MKIAKFEQGQKVVMIVNNKMKIGTIVNLYTQLQNPIMIVDFNGDCVKVPVEKIAPYEEPKKDGVTITAKEFTDISAKIIVEECAKLGADDVFLLIPTGVIVSKIGAKLYGEADNDKVISPPGGSSMKFKDLTGKKFGRLTVIKRVGDKKQTQYLCECECGNKRIVYASNLLRGKSTSCGCYRKEKLHNDRVNILEPGTKI